jgi:hypothetical protein
MATVRVLQLVPGPVHEAEKAWYDTSRWPQWVDQLTQVVDVQGEWPRPGSVVVWESGPAGRGQVVERVVEYEPLRGLTAEVEDASITGTQRVAFDPVPDGVQVELSLNYRLRRRSPLSALVDLLFIRRLMGASLAKTLAQFRATLEASSPASFE